MVSEKKTICLTMIVKNEGHLIIDCFDMLSKYIKFDYWAINDNGSTDGTQDLIRNYFKAKGIPGELDETPWQDFAFNRTRAFNVAYKKADYAFVWDADDEIYGKFSLPENPTADAYRFVFGNEGGGVDPELLAISRSVLIPQDPRIESLNVGAAAAVCLFEMRRVRREIK